MLCMEFYVYPLQVVGVSSPAIPEGPEAGSESDMLNGMDRIDKPN